MGRGWAAAGAALLAAANALPAQAQPTRPLRLQVPPVDFRTPPDNNPGLGTAPDHRSEGCMPEWPCRLRLFGVIERNGGVGLRGTALNW
ncbi:MAG TPA: hypothetical protein VGM07_14065 [Stellaceae bacterium]|jgi:hypothetical protein